jgi:hypothetical protein
MGKGPTKAQASKAGRKLAKDSTGGKQKSKAGKTLGKYGAKKK